jgi:hypothetical protein
MIEDQKINKAIGRFLNAELKKRGITHEVLSTRLKGEGWLYSKSSIATKLSRGTFSATFYMQCLMVIGYDSTEITELKKIIKE